MTTAKSGVDYVSPPKDYAALYETYYDYVVAFVRKLGIGNGLAEDVASEILLRFYERDALNTFDPTLVFEYNGKEHPARFKSWLSRFVVNYVRGHRDKISRLASREVLVCDHPIDADGTRWIDIHGGTEPNHDDSVLASVEEQRLVAQMRKYFATVPRRSDADRCDLLKLLDAVVAQARSDGKVNVNQLAEKFDVSASAMHTWLWWLKANAAAALGVPMPVKRTKRTSPA